MYCYFQKSDFAGFNRIIVVAAILCICITLSFGEEVSLSEVPQAARAVIERETKGYKIDEIERDKDDGKIVYEVDAELQDDDDREIKLKIAPDGTVLEKEEKISSGDLPAVVLDTVKKLFGQVDFDEIEKRYRQGRNTYFKIEADTDELEIDLEIAVDGTILDKDVDRKDDDDDDMPGDFRDIRKLFIKIRHQLKLAAIGDSRVEKGVDTKLFCGQDNKKYPMALNFGSGGSGLGLCAVIIEDYLVHAPNLDWVVYGISPRAFNVYYRSNEGKDIKKSRLYKSDKSQGTIWQQINTKLVSADAINMNDDISPWGLFDPEDGIDDDMEDEDEREDALDDLRKGRYKLDEGRYGTFESLIKLLAGNNVKMLGFTPPMHPITKGQPCTDDDGTTRQGYNLFVEKMEALDKKYSNFIFVDINHKGEHNFEYKEFNTLDHLNMAGARKLTLMLNKLIGEFDLAKKTGDGEKLVSR